MLHRHTLILLFIIPLQAFSQIGWYLKVNGNDWNQNMVVTNTDKLVFGMKEGSNLTPCYNLNVSTLSQDGTILFSPSGIKNPWNIDLATALTGKTGKIKMEIKGKSCNNTAEQWWVIEIMVSAGSNTTSANTNTATIPAGTTAITSISKTSPRTQHVVAKVVFTNKTGKVNKINFVTGYPVTNNYQTVSNMNTGGAVVKTTPTGSKYLEYTFSNVPQNGTVVAKYEYDIITYSINMNLSKAASKPYKVNADYTNFTRSVPVQTDLNNAKLKAICDDLWSKSNNDYIAYARNVAEWMNANTVWKFTGGILPLNDFMNNQTNGKCTGDCGSLSNAFCAMLRYKGIPARLLVGYGIGKMTAQDAKLHAWIEFYIEDFGWIPVDPSYRTSAGIELGKVNHKGIIVSYDAFYDLNIMGSVFKNMLIQNYGWAVSGSIPTGSYDLNFTVVSTGFKE